MVDKIRRKVMKDGDDVHCSFCGGGPEDDIGQLVRNEVSGAAICPDCAERAIKTFENTKERLAAAVAESFAAFMRNGMNLKDEDGKCWCPKCIARREFEATKDSNFSAAEVVPADVTRH